MVVKGKRLRSEIPAGLEEWVANRQVSAYFRIAEASLWGQLFNGVVLSLTFVQVAPNKWPVVALMVAQLILFMQRRHISKLSARTTADTFPSAISNQIGLNSAGLAMTYALGTAWLFPLAGQNAQILIAVGMTAMIGVSGFASRYIPSSSQSYVTILAAGLAVGLLRMGVFETAIAAAVIGAVSLRIATMAKISSETFISRILRERDLASSTQTVKMLLNDFQDQGSDWLFELDCDARLVGVSARFASALQVDPEDLNGRCFTDLFDNAPERDQLLGHIAERRAFRGLALPLSKGGAVDGWWSISARPVDKSSTDVVKFRGVISDISASKQADARVRYMAHYDSLTDLPNRTFFASALNRQFQILGDDARLAMMLVDIDHFKSVNDIYGHLVGDAFVRQVGERITACVNKTGLGGEGHIVARLGGDEFALLMGGEDVIDHALRLAQALVETLGKPFEIDGHTINSGASIGVAMAPLHANNAQMLQSNADIALYSAKNNGRGRWEMFEAGMDTAVQQRHAIERDLRLALIRDEFRLYFQPLVNVETSNHIGFEALIRWEHPEHGMVMPDSFIPIAEESGLIVPMGEWVIKTAMAEAVRWSEPRTIAINLSPVQLRSPNLMPTIINALATTGLDPNRFEVEITESVLLNDCEANIAILNRLHDLGIKIALDDFGTGYASLNYLRTFPFDKIKIDRSFVTELANRADCRAIVSAVISLANNLGMCTVAEGVESEEQMAALRSEGCSMVQGWLFGKAMPADHYAGLRTVLPAPPPVLLLDYKKAA